MKITNKRLCTNEEALAFINGNNKLQLESIEQKVKTYIEKYYSLGYDKTKAKDIIKRMQEMDLARLEIFQLINLKPQKLVELFLVVKDCDHRYNESQQQELLSLIQLLK